jgi:hypothetical protein
LLDDSRPNLHWRVLVELVGRPDDSPAVRRARGGANAAEPVAGLLADLQPDGCWATTAPMWDRDTGPGWRLVAAVQWGADPEDPRLHAASERLLESAPGEGGLSRSPDAHPDPQLTARVLETMIALGWTKHPRVQEWIAWFEGAADWYDDPVVCVAVLGSAAGRKALRESAVGGITGALTRGRAVLRDPDHPNLETTDLAEIFARLAGAGIRWRSDWRAGLAELQELQDERGRWSADRPETSPWVTLKATKALLTYAVDAGLPRVFPYPPGR